MHGNTLMIYLYVCKASGLTVELSKMRKYLYMYFENLRCYIEITTIPLPT